MIFTHMNQTIQSMLALPLPIKWTLFHILPQFSNTFQNFHHNFLLVLSLLIINHSNNQLQFYIKLLGFILIHQFLMIITIKGAGYSL